MKRTNTCGELAKEDIGKSVILQGWVQTARDHGGVIFVDLRDRYGVTQVVFDPKINKDMHKTAESLRREFVIECEGKVRPRPEGMANPKLVTGEIEVECSRLEILNKAATPPIEVDDKKIASDDLRMKWRYLDLRRPTMQKRLLIRHKAIKAVHEFLDSNNFLEIQTPLLVKSTPEGARDYVVPSRVNPGKFYALPQSPQLYKQILMVSGCDRYYQMATCLRDEDLRADRQPEHTQIDMEMSFVEIEDIFNVVEGLMKNIFKKAIGVDIKLPFQRIPYVEAIEKYGTDKPDLRFGFELIDVGEIVKDSDFSVFKKVIAEGGQVKCINAKGCANISRKQIEGEWTDFAAEYGAKGLAWMKVKNGKLDSSIVKFFSEEIQKKLIVLADAKENDLLFFVADKPKIVAEALGHLRLKVAKHLDLLNPDEFKFAWVTEFPLFEWDEEEEKYTPAHHMFCMPKQEYIDMIEKEPGKVVCTQYDLTLNGIELASGSIRINRPEIQEKVMKVIGLTKEQAKKKFGFLLEAFKYGAPPHGGIGIGFDRIVALMCGTNDIREVIAFPKNKAAQCPMDGSPSEIDSVALKEAHIKLDL
ncbi:aspartate--tRNA ligase, partial [Candidatus Woesearchaeota archaeon]|nr:aspartate--tRNA ligase [Candidatus Woesearchaeota archaeon]